MSQSNIEEIIACLWSILLAILWANDAPMFLLIIVGIKAAADHITSIVCAVRETPKK